MEPPSSSGWAGPMAEPVLDIADELYGLPAAEFTAARDAAAKAAEDRALATRIKALRRPTASAWAVNLLVRREAEQIDQVLAVAESLRAAAEAMDGEELRALTRQRRQLTAALATSARSLAREQGATLSAAITEQVEGMLTAAMLDPVAARVVRSGLVVSAFSSTGLDGLDPAAVCAVPEAVEGPADGHRAPAAGAPATRPALSVVPDDGARLEAARERMEEATVELAAAEEHLAHVVATERTLSARRLQLQGEIDELHRRLAGLEEDVDAVDDQAEENEAAHAEAVAEVEAAREERAAAQRALDELG